SSKGLLNPPSSIELAALVFATLIDCRYSKEMILRARVVVTMDGPPIENGAVAVAANRIIDVGKFDEVKARYRKSIDDSPPDSSPSRASRLRRPAPAGSVVDLGEQALLPGLINAHCHLDYTY